MTLPLTLLSPIKFFTGKLTDKFDNYPEIGVLKIDANEPLATGLIGPNVHGLGKKKSHHHNSQQDPKPPHPSGFVPSHPFSNLDLSAPY